MAKSSSSVPGERLQLSAVLTPTLAGNPVVVLPKDSLQGLKCPILAEVSRPGTRRQVWAYREGGVAASSNVPIAVPTGNIGLSNRTWQLLGVPETGDHTITFVSPPHRLAKVLTSKVNDIPVGLTVHVSPSLAHELGKIQGGSRWALATHSDQAVPLRLVVRQSLKHNAIRMSMLVRILLGVKSGDDMQLCSFPDRTKADRLSSLGERVPVLRRIMPSSRIPTIVGGVFFVWRLIDTLTEWFLRFVFRAPEIVVRTVQAQVGDDDFGSIRLHPSVFATLGVVPGAQVIVEWGGRRTVAIAMEDYKSHAEIRSPIVEKAQMVELTSAQLDTSFPDHLVGRLSAEVRHDLGAPALTVIGVRRRLRTLVLTHLNQLVVPLGGLLVAAAALPELRGWPLVGGAIVITLLALANLRLPRPRKGLWP